MYMGVGILVGLIFYFLFSLLGLDMIGYILIGVFAFVGFGIATLKVPNVTFLKGARLAAGEQIDEVIKRAIKFKMNKNKYYVYLTNDKKVTQEKEGGKTDGK